MKFTFEQIDPSRLPSLMWVGLLQLAEGQTTAQRLSEGKYLLPDCLQAGTLVFSCLLTVAETSALFES